MSADLAAIRARAVARHANPHDHTDVSVCIDVDRLWDELQARDAEVARLKILLENTVASRDYWISRADKAVAALAEPSAEGGQG